MLNTRRGKFTLTLILLVGSVAIVALTTMTGYVLGALSSESEYRKDFLQWHQLAIPEGTAQKIVDADTFFVRIQTTTERYYCRIEQPLPPSIPCDKDANVAAIPTSHPAVVSKEFCGSTTPMEPPGPPGQIVDHIAVLECAADAEWQFNYVVLSDGSAWAWDVGGGMIGLGQVAYSAIGALFGFLVGILLAIVFFGLVRARTFR